MSKQARIAIAAALVLAGCGKKHDDAGKTKPPGTPSTKEPSKPDQAGSGSAGSAAGSAVATGVPDPWAAPDPWAQPGAGGGSGAGSGSGSDAKPPSTGNELPSEGVAMTADQANAVIADAIKQVEAGKDPPCAQIADQLMVALPIAFPDATEAAAPGLMALAKCAKKTERWRSLVMAGSALLEIQAKPDPRTPSQVVRALAEMGEYDKAIEVAGTLAKKFPDSRPMLAAATTFVYCRAEAWDQCVKTGDDTLAALKKNGVPDTDDSVYITRILRDLGWVVAGKPKEALADMAAVEKVKGPMPPGVEKIKEAAEQAIDRGFYFEVVPISQLPIGVYHLMGRKDTGALITLKLREQAGKARTFRVEAEVPGVTERSSNTLSLKAKESSVKWVNPPLKMDFDAAKVRNPRPSQLVLKVVEVAKGGDKTIFDETIPIEVLPRDYLPLKRKIGADAEAPTYGYLGAWITSNEPSIDEFLKTAKARVPGHNFVGEQDETAPQVKAIFDELKSRGVTYVTDPGVTSDTAFVQRTRLPVDVLASTNAQCLEGTLLFATMFEAIGLKPIIVIVPGHAFVGWHTVPKDGTKGEPLFVETTMVGGFTFEQAARTATERVAKELAAGSFKSGAATFVDVEAIRQAGFTAQP